MKSQIRHGSCLDEKHGLPAMKANSVDHFILDPPYEEYTHSNRMGLRKEGGKGKAKPLDVQMGFEFISDEERSAVAVEMVRVGRGWVIVFCEDYAIRSWVDALVEAGAKRKTTMQWITLMWEKTNAAPRFDGSGPAQATEHMVSAWVGRGKSQWNCGGKRGLYKYAVPATAKRRHSTEKPLRLMQQLILDFTRPNQIVCDPYAGGGTTLIAAKNLGRQFLGWEIDPDTVEKARKALQQTHEQLDIERLLQPVKASGRRNPVARRKEEQLGLSLEDKT